MFTKETEECSKLVDCFENELPLEVQSRNWLKLFNNILYKCFRKVRVVNNSKKKAGNEKLLHERIELKKESKLSTVSEEMKLEMMYQKGIMKK